MSVFAICGFEGDSQHLPAPNRILALMACRNVMPRRVTSRTRSRSRDCTLAAPADSICNAAAMLGRDHRSLRPFRVHI